MTQNGNWAMVSGGDALPQQVKQAYLTSGVKSRFTEISERDLPSITTYFPVRPGLPLPET